MAAETQLIKMYSRTTCPMDPPVKQMLNTADAAYEYIDIRQDEEAKALVKQINNGNESVPTLVFPNGSTLTEPSPMSLRKHLITMGYEVPATDFWLAYARGMLLSPIYLFLIVMVIFAVLRILGVF